MSREIAATARMQTLIDEWERASDNNADFLRCYYLMTNNVLLALDVQEFHDPAWVSQLLERFAIYYFQALEAYESDPAAAAPVWQTAFAAARDPEALALQNVLLGVNAHINYDLVFTLADMLRPEWDSLTETQRANRYDDHCQINNVIASTIDSVQDQILAPSMMGMALLDQIMGPLDEYLVSRLIAHWREEVWQNAARLLEARTASEQAEVLEAIEAQAGRLASLIYPRGLQ